MLLCAWGWQVTTDRKRAGRAGFCSLILREDAGEGYPLLEGKGRIQWFKIPVPKFCKHFSLPCLFWYKDSSIAFIYGIGYIEYFLYELLYVFSKYWSF